MDEKRRDEIKQRTKKFLKKARETVTGMPEAVWDSIKRHKKIAAVSLLLFQQVGQTVMASSSVKDKKTDPISVLANQQIRASNADWSAYLNEGKRLSKEEMTYLVNKAIKDGHLIPEFSKFSDDYTLYTVNPNNPGPFAIGDNFRATKDDKGNLVGVELKNAEKVVIDQFSKGMPVRSTVSDVEVVEVSDYYSEENCRIVKTKEGTVLTQYYAVDSPTLILTSKDEGMKTTVRYPNDPRLINPGGFSVTTYDKKESGEVFPVTTTDYAYDGNTVVRKVYHGDETKGIATYAELIMPDGNKCTVIDYRNSICVVVGDKVTEVSTRTIEWNKKIQGNDDKTSFDDVCSGVLKKGKGWFDNLQKYDNMNKANNNTNGYN